MSILPQPSRYKGPLLLILPGNTASSAHHEGELSYFARAYRAVSLDFRGVGRSERLAAWPDDWWQVGAQDAAALVAHLGYQECLVMGSSGGAIAALKMAALYPRLVRAVLADSCVRRKPPRDWQAVVADREQSTPSQEGFWHYGHGDDWREVVRADNKLLLRLAERGGDLIPEGLGGVRCQVLFTASLRDEMLPDVGRQLCEMALEVQGSRVFLCDCGRHPLMWSRPNEFRAFADCFLSGIEEARRRT